MENAPFILSAFLKYELKYMPYVYGKISVSSIKLGNPLGRAVDEDCAVIAFNEPD